jgi:hypothetical protein
MADPKGFLQDLLGEAGDLIAWVRKTLQDPEARKATLLDLGLDPNENNDAAIADTSIDNIKRYRDAVDPDEAAFRSAVQDLRAFYQALKEFIKLWGISDRIDEFAYRYVELLGTNYFRLRSPHLFYLGQLLGFIVESRLSVEGIPTRQGVLPAAAWNLLTDPFGYIKDLPGNLKKGGRPDLKTTEDSEAWSLLFLSLPLLLKVSDSDAEMRFLYSWDRLPRSFAGDGKAELRASFHGTHLLEKVRNDFQAEFPLPDDAEGAWAAIEAAAAAAEPSEIQKTVRSAYLLAVERWKRGEWVDLVSETAFSFDFRLPDSDDGVEKILGGSLFFVAREDVPIDIGADDLITTELSGGLFASLNGELNIKEPLGTDWEFVLKTSSGDVLDVFLSEASDLNAVGDMRIEAGLSRKPDPATGASYNLPDASGTRFAVGGIKISGFLTRSDAGIEIGLKDNALVVSGQNADGFLQEVMPAGEVPLKFSLAAGLSRSKGFYFNHDIGFLNDLLGTGDAAKKRSIARSVSTVSRAVDEEEEAKRRALDIKFPIHAQTGPARFESVNWSYGKTRKKDALGGRLAVTTTLSSKLGPVYARVDGVGMELDISMPQPGGDLTGSAVDFGFVPPKGVGLRIEADAISGGGFLEFDPDNHRYAGVATLNFLELELSAVGLINTRLPNNQPGFSLLLCISVIFEPPYLLPYQFTLQGVGGIVGVNRTMKVDVLRDRIRDGAINSIMFPKNIVENAAKIISDLRAIFPPQAKHCVVAPFLKIGWGSPTVLEVDLGIFIEFPFKGRLILIGALSICLPSKKADTRLVDLRVDIFGDFNFAESYVLVEGRLRDGSHVAGVALAGGFAFVLDWGSDPQFLLSVGGYHPRYQKPARFPDIPRLSAQIKRGDAVRLTCLYYQAITSNTFQIGFSAEVTIKKGNATAIGFLGFNALLQFDPLYFEVDIRISVQIAYRGRSFAGIELEFLLSGPRPWRAVGYAKIKILFFSLKIRFNESWGGEQKPAPATVAPDTLLADLKRQLGQKNNWTARLTPGFSRAEALRSLDDIDKQERVVVHPGGSLEIRQTLVPLNRSIERLGNSKVNNRPVYRIESYRLGSGPAVAVAQREILREHFARGQFEDLPDKERIAAADFEMMPAGIRLGAGQALDLPPEMESTGNDFDQFVLRDDAVVEPGAAPRFSVTRATAAHNWQVERSLNLSAARTAADANRPEEVFALLETLPDYRETDYEIVSKANLRAPADLADRRFRTRSEALDYFKGRWGEWSAEWQIRETTTVMEESLTR